MNVNRLQFVNKEAAEQALTDARNYLGAIETATRFKDNSSHIGHFYRRRSNYSCPEKPSDYWWVYTAVTGIDEHGALQGWQFEKDKYAKIVISTSVEGIYPSVYLTNRISKVTFYNALGNLLKDVTSLVSTNVKERKRGK